MLYQSLGAAASDGLFCAAVPDGLRAAVVRVRVRRRA
jgi:hypothetical protein